MDLTFNQVNTIPETPAVGGVYFVKDKHVIGVGQSDGSVEYFGGEGITELTSIGSLNNVTQYSVNSIYISKLKMTVNGKSGDTSKSYVLNHTVEGNFIYAPYWGLSDEVHTLSVISEDNNALWISLRNRTTNNGIINCRMSDNYWYTVCQDIETPGSTLITSGLIPVKIAPFRHLGHQLKQYFSELQNPICSIMFEHFDTKGVKQIYYIALGNFNFTDNTVDCISHIVRVDSVGYDTSTSSFVFSVPEGNKTLSLKTDGSSSQFLAADGQYRTVSVTIPTASSNTIGGIKIGYSERSNNKPVSLDSNNKAYVNTMVYENNEDVTDNLTSELRSQVNDSTNKSKLPIIMGANYGGWNVPVAMIRNSETVTLSTVFSPTAGKLNINTKNYSNQSPYSKTADKSMQLIFDGNANKTLREDGTYAASPKPGCIYLSEVSGSDTAGNYVIGTACRYMVQGEPFVILCAGYNSLRPYTIIKVWFECPENAPESMLNTQSYSTTVKPDLAFEINASITNKVLP